MWEGGGREASPYPDWAAQGESCGTRHLAPQPTQGKRDTVDLLNELIQGRESYRRQAWAAAYQSLAQADQATLLDVEDLERLATSAYLSGREDECLRVLERAHQA